MGDKKMIVGRILRAIFWAAFCVAWVWLIQSLNWPSWQEKPVRFAVTLATGLFAMTVGAMFIAAGVWLASMFLYVRLEMMWQHFLGSNPKR